MCSLNKSYGQDLGKRNLVVIPSALNVYNEMLFEVGQIPHILIPISGKSIIDYIIKEYSDKLENCTFLIITKENTKLIEEYVNLNLTERYDVRIDELSELKDLGWTILKGLESVNLNEFDNVIINFGDTYIQDFKFNGQDAVYYAKRSEAFRWTIFDEKDGKIESIVDKEINNFTDEEHNVIVGVFLIRDAQKLVEKLQSTTGFYPALQEYLKDRKYELITADRWYDVGHVDNYYYAKKVFINKRFFNTVKIDKQRAVLTKRSKNIEKFINEIKWYLKLPNSLQYLVPRVFNYSLSCEDPFVELEYYGYPSLCDVFVYGNYDLGVWYYIFEAIFFSLDEMGQYKLDCSKEKIRNSQNDMYVKKTKARVNQYSKFFKELMGKKMIINGVEHRPLSEMLNLLDSAFDILITGDSLNIIHGDYCLSNMLFDPKQRILKLIDPRGKFARFSVYGDYKYDLAKLSHSFLGNYEFIINDRFTFTKDGNNIQYSIYKKDKQQKISDMFEHNLKKYYRNDLIQIKFIEALLFISMIPLHSDFKDRQIIMYCTGLEKLSNVFDQIRFPTG
ncbi:hypothetical protein K9M79_00855 [Candidatus Woesearchaeota archaeon]|nr:hypothetical protein [Candidatus Woesearchaeota archaeon]